MNFDTSCSSCITNASGIPCDCSVGFLWDSATEVCGGCTINCDTCTGGDFAACTFCSTGYYLCQSVCVAACPNGYTTNTVARTCTLSNSLSFKFAPSSLQDIVVDSVASFSVTTGSSTVFYPSYVTGDPYAARYRRYYFTGSSYMKAPPNSASTSNFYISPQFTVTAWVKPTSTSGCLLQKQNVGDVTSFSIVCQVGTSKPVYSYHQVTRLQGLQSILKRGIS